MYKHILIATDGSELAEKAVAAGLAIARELQAKVTAITVSQPWTAVATGEMAVVFPYEEYEKEAAENAARILANVTEAAKSGGVDCTSVCGGYCRLCQDKACDLIVMASHGRRGLSKLLLGSETMRVVTHSSVPVLCLPLTAISEPPPLLLRRFGVARIDCSLSEPQPHGLRSPRARQTLRTAFGHQGFQLPLTDLLLQQ